MSSQMDTPEIRKYVEEATDLLIKSYGNILSKMPNIKVNTSTLCDLNISIAASFMMNILHMLEKQFKPKLGDIINKRNTFDSIRKHVEGSFKLN